MNELQKKIASKTAVIGTIGMGYIGLSLLAAFGQAGFPLVGFDLDEKKVEMLKHKKTYLNFIDCTHLFSLLDQHLFKPSSDPNILKHADILVICVPTSLDLYHVPDLTRLKEAFQTVSNYLKKDQLIILQSSTYPGTTEEALLPIIEASGLKVGKEIFLAHVPEVVDIGNQEFNFNQVPRIVSGITPACREMAEKLYAQLGCPIVKSSSPRIAESAKLLQNAYRLINISFINEMKIMFDRMNIDIWEVIEAAKSKPFGFTAFEPGPGIGGDCIPKAPFYLVWKARITEGPTTMLEQAGQVDESMHLYVLNKIILGLNQQKKSIRGAKILILGLGYKKDVNDIRESAALKILHTLKEMNAEVSYHDPYVLEISHVQDHPDLYFLESINLVYEELSLYDAVVIVTDHSCYDWEKIAQNSNLIIDTRNAMKGIQEAKNKVIKA